MGLFDLFSDKNEAKAKDLQIQGINSGFNYATGKYNEGRDALKSGFGDAQGYFAPLAQGANSGYAAYGDATGANGAAGMSRARELFTASPGYQEGLDRGLDSLDRRAASRGMLGSGNTQIDTLKYANDYADTKYNSYVDNLSPYLGAATGIAGSQAGLSAGLGQALDTSLGNQGSLGFQKEIGIGNAQAGFEKGKDQTGANILGAITGVAKTAAGFF